MPLETAIKAARQIYDKNRHAVIMREDAAKDLGYSGLSGRALAILGAMNQYDLIENVSKGQMRVTKTAAEIFHGYPEDVQTAALRKAANAPALYNDIYERFDGDIPGENAVKSFLFQRGFTNEGVQRALRVFFENNRYLEIAGASESYRAVSQNRPESAPTTQREEEPRIVEANLAASGVGKPFPPFNRAAPLDFSLTSTGIALTGSTNSAAELKSFIERLKVLAAVLPDDSKAENAETEQ